MSGASNERDYYEILGVLRTAKSADITAAYHFLASKYHPDFGSADRESLAEFKLVSKAYEVLSDEHLRRAYDRQRAIPRINPPVESSAFSFVASARPSSFRAKSISPETPTPRDMEVELPITPEESRHGGRCDFTLRVASVCGQCDGQCSIGGNSCETCQGEGRTHEKRRLQLTLPRQVQTGTVIRIVGYGKRSATTTGDLLVRLRIQPCW